MVMGFACFGDFVSFHLFQPFHFGCFGGFVRFILLFLVFNMSYFSNLQVTQTKKFLSLDLHHSIMQILPRYLALLISQSKFCFPNGGSKNQDASLLLHYFSIITIINIKKTNSKQQEKHIRFQIILQEQYVTIDLLHNICFI